MEQTIKKRLLEIEKKHLKRDLTLVQSPQSARVTINGREVIVLCSNNYLGLANHPLVKEAMIRAIKIYGAGAGASRLISGTMTPHEELEEKLKSFKKCEKALLFNSGYHANIGLIPALVSRGGAIFSDKLNHASIIDGCILSRATIKRYAHRDVNWLERLLKKSAAKNKLIITEGIFSMDGDVAHLKEIIALAEKYGAIIYLDDAHAFGILGKNGRGTLEHFSIDHPSVIEMGTLGKAVGVYGAFVAGSEKLISLLINKARSFIYSTALPPPVCAGAVKAIEIIENEPQRRLRLMENACFMRDSLKENSFDTLLSSAHIIPLVIGTAEKALNAAKKLLDKGVFIQAIRPPTVPENTSRLRITVTSEHTKNDIAFAVNAIKETLR